MPAHRSQGKERYEAERHDELSDGIPATMPADADHGRRADGRVGAGNAMAVLGGKARKGRTRLTHDVQSLQVPDKLRRQARFMRRRTCTELSTTVGGGHCGIIASALVKLASEDMALREHALSSGEVDTARKLGESARGHLLYAREICVKDAEARPRAPVDPLARWRLPGEQK